MMKPSDQVYPIPVIRFKRFLRLPRELRNQIYFLLLIEPPKWTKRHNPLCSVIDRRGTNPEQPPWTLFTNEYDAAGRRKRELQCHCSRRQSLGLLLANRLIHAEAAPIFWWNNVFCFDDSRTFVEDVGTVLRKEHRQYIRHISITPPSYTIDNGQLTPEGFYGSGEELWDDKCMWKTIFTCKNLRTMEVRSECVEHHIVEFKNIRSRLVHLKSLALVQLQIYDLVEPRPQPPFGRVFTAADRQSIYVKIARNISLYLTQNDLRNAVRDFRTNFFTYVDFRIKKDFLCQPWPTNIGGWVPSSFPHRTLLDSLRDDSNPAITLSDGRTITVSIYGLPKRLATPTSRATRLRLVKERHALEARLKAAEMPSTQEMRVRFQVKATRKKKEEEEREERSRNGLTSVEAKKELRRKQEEEKRLKVTQKALCRINARRAEAMRKEERELVLKKA